MPPSQTDVSELGAAMVAAARVHATVFVEHRDGSVEFNAWWRGGDGVKVRVWPDRAAWADIKAHGMGDAGAGGGAKAFAHVALSMTLREMMDQYGAGVGMPGQPTTRAPRSEPVRGGTRWAPGDAHRCWTSHLASASPEEMTRVMAWLRRTRGISSPPVSGMLALRPELVPAVPIQDAVGDEPKDVQAWCKQQVDRGGRAVLLPKWTAHGTVGGLVMRFGAPRPGGKKSLNLKGLSTSEPTAFGLPHRLKTSRVAFVVEGAPDTWAAEWLLRPHLAAPVGAERSGMTVVGVDGTGTLRHWVEPVARSGVEQVVLVPQLDDAGAKAMAAFGQEVAARGTPVVVASWDALLQGALGCSFEERPTKLKDLADVTREAAARGVGVDALRDALWRAVGAAVHGGQRAA